MADYNTMRYRSQSHVTNVSGNYISRDLKTGAAPTTPFSVNVVDSESLMWDEQTGGSRAIKPVTHLSYVVDDLAVQKDQNHSQDMSNIPDPRTRYEGVHWWSDRLAIYRPSATQSQAESYIAVTGMTSDDLGNCLSQAYNQFVNGVRALDASTSIAESGETPRLFSAWQRRRGLATNLVSGFLSYSFGWKPLIRDLVAIHRELKLFPETVRRRLKSIGDKEVVRHFVFNLSSTVNNVTFTDEHIRDPSYSWAVDGGRERTVSKSRKVVVTIRANVKPKLTGESQDLLNKLGALGLIPSLATLWSVTRLSFVVDWFYNIGGAIENLQGSLTHDIKNMSVCISDARTRVIEARCTSASGGLGAHLSGRITQRYYRRYKTTIPLLPPVRLPSRAMNYVLLGLLGLSSTKRGKLILRAIDGSPLSKAVSAKVRRGLERLSPSQRANVFKTVAAGTLKGTRNLAKFVDDI